MVKKPKKKKRPKAKVKRPEVKEVDEREALLFQVQAQLLDKLQEALDSQHWMVVVCHLNGSDIRVWAKLGDYLAGDIEKTMQMLNKELTELVAKQKSPPLPGSEGAQPQDPG